MAIGRKKVYRADPFVQGRHKTHHGTFFDEKFREEKGFVA
jgi:hypothetical protein